MPNIIFITGATSGFGKASAEIFAEKGYNLILNGRRTDRLAELSSKLTSQYKVSVHQLPFDVRDEKLVNECIDSLPAEWKNIDVFLNNAGLALGRDYFEEANMDDWNTMVDTNVKGFMYVAKAVSKLMAANKKGHIINIGSIAGRQVYEKGNVYCATKFAVDALSQAMRVDLLRHKIRVTHIQPGAAETEFSLVRFKGEEETAKTVYEGLEALSGRDVAEVIWYCASLPSHVCVNVLEVTCTRQADAYYYNRTP